MPQPKSFPPTPQDVYDHWRQTGVVLRYDECAQMNEFQSKVVHFWIDHPGEKARLIPLDAQWLWQPDVVETRGRPGAGSWLDTLRSSAEPAYMIPLYVLAVVGLFFAPGFLSVLTVLPLVGAVVRVRASFHLRPVLVTREAALRRSLDERAMGCESRDESWMAAK